ncbi:MAG: hypothetical protein QOJ44_2268, partial [Acidimicrobiaceae bacterium]|nr:hypothetical protein [Acidimicrobiaceae bacterium]
TTSSAPYKVRAACFHRLPRTACWPNPSVEHGLPDGRSVSSSGLGSDASSDAIAPYDGSWATIGVSADDDRLRSPLKVAEAISTHDSFLSVPHRSCRARLMRRSDLESVLQQWLV